MQPPVDNKRVNDAHRRLLAQLEAKKAAANNKPAQQPFRLVPADHQPPQHQPVNRQPAQHPPAQHPPAQHQLVQYQPVYHQLAHHRSAQHRPAQPPATRQTPPDENHRTRGGQGAVPRPDRDQIPSYYHNQSQQVEVPTTEEPDSWFVREVSAIMRAVPTIEEAGFWRWGFRFVGAIVAIIWTVAKPVLWWLATIILPIFIGFFVLAFLAGWAIEGLFGGLHTVQVRACNNILPHRFFFADWCDGINKASRPLIASSKPLPSSSAGNPLTLTESFSLQKPDRHFCVFAFGDMLGAMADEQQKYMTDKQRESFAPMRRAGAVVEQLQDIGRKQARTVERAQEKTLRLVHDPAALWSKHDPPPPPPPPPQPLGLVWSLLVRTQPPPPPPSVILQGLVREILRVLQGEVTSRTQFVKDVAALSQEMAEVASNVCGWNTVLEERISDKTQRLIEGEARHSQSMSPKYLLLRIYFFFVDNWPRRATKGTTGEVLKWEDQANVIRNEITKWRRRKSKASVLCKTLTVGAGKTAILLKAIQNEETHLGEMAQGAKDLLAEVLSQGVNASNNALQHLSKTARDLCIAYLQSFQQHYPKC